jgi:hypothetical protein
VDFEVRRGVYHITPSKRVRNSTRCAVLCIICLNPTKVANAFVWCSDYDEIADLLMGTEKNTISRSSQGVHQPSISYEDEQRKLAGENANGYRTTKTVFVRVTLSVIGS